MENNKSKDEIHIFYDNLVESLVDDTNFFEWFMEIELEAHEKTIVKYIQFLEYHFCDCYD